MDDGIIAALIGGGFVSGVLCGRGDCDLRARHSITLRVSHCTNDAAVHGLARSGIGAQIKAKTKHNERNPKRTSCHYTPPRYNRSYEHTQTYESALDKIFNGF